MILKKLTLFTFCYFITFLSSAQKFQDTIPFRDDLGLIIIPVNFNGKIKQMAFDTGADVTIAYGWAKEELRSTNKMLNIRSSSNLKSRMRYYKSGVISLGSRKIRKHWILNAPKNDILSCYQVDGILGTDIIKLLNWTIDYANKRLIMYPSDYFPSMLSNMYQLDFDYKNKRPYVYLTRKNQRFQFLLDTGAGGRSNISKRQYTLKGLEKLKTITIFSGNYDVNGIFTKSQSSLFSFPKSTSKGVELRPIINYNNQKSSKIGNRLWDNQALFLSLKSKKLYLSTQKITETYSSYPAALSYQNGFMRILSIEEGSNLWKKGLRQGDKITKINDSIFNNFCDLDKYQRNLMKTGAPFIIKLSDKTLIPLKKQEILFESK